MAARPTSSPSSASRSRTCPGRSWSSRAGSPRRSATRSGFSIDLPDANAVIQISGTFGSRQEEAQRLGRILRPKSAGSLAHFYSLVTKETKDQDFAAKRQLFLTEHGYRYVISDGLAGPVPVVSDQWSVPSAETTGRFEEAAARVSLPAAAACLPRLAAH